MLVSPFDNPRRQPGSLQFAPNAWGVTTGFPLFLPHAVSLGVSPLVFLISSLGWELIPSFALWAAILASVLCFMEGLMPCCSHSFLTCICCSLVMEFQTAMGCISHSSFLTLGLTGWLPVFAIWTDCVSRLFSVTIWPRLDTDVSKSVPYFSGWAWTTLTAVSNSVLLMPWRK